MKKSILALAILGTAAIGAQAANVTLYGSVDAGFQYTHTKFTSFDKDTKVKTTNTSNSFKLADAISGSNSIGLKGEEELGSGSTMGFQLENEFHVANGAFDEDGKLFSAEARVYVNGPFGEIAAGRMGGLDSASGTYDVFFANVDAFDGGDQLPTGFVKTGNLDNSIVYATPDLAGFKAYGMYSFSVDKKQENKFSQNARYAALGATYEVGDLTLAATTSFGIPESKDKDEKAITPKAKKPYVFGFGGNYKLNDDVQLFGGLQYAKNVVMLTSNGMDITDGDRFSISKSFESADPNHIPSFAKSYAGTLGVNYTFGNSTITAAGYYAHYTGQTSDAKGPKEKTNYASLQGRYTYSLSSRTSLYAGLDGAYLKTKGQEKATAFTAYTGLRHEF